MANMPSNQNSLNLIYNKILSDLKNSSPIWDDFLSKSSKLHTAIRNVLQCSTIFWEAFQKLADLATDTQGATKEIGASLTRLCMRQRLIESKIKNLNHHLLASLTNPVQDKMEEWKRVANQLDKDRFKETKKAKVEWKKATEESMRLQKKAQKRGSMRGLGSLQNQVEGALQKAADKYSGLQYVESLCLKRAMIHERERFCFLYTCIKPVLECQISLLSDITSLDELMKALALSTGSPDKLPTESEEIIQHIIDPDYKVSNKSNCNLSGNTVFSSGFGSRKSSVASLNSHQSLSSGSGPSTTAINLERRNTDSNFMFNVSSRNGYNRGSFSSDCYPNFKQMDYERSLTQIGDYYRNVFSKKEDDPGLRTSHISMTSSIQEPSGISGDYRVSDDDSKNIGESGGEEESDEEDVDDDDDEEEESEEEAKTPSSPSTSLWSEKLGPGSDSGAKFLASRHTISGATAFTRPALSPGIFEPLNKGGHTSDASLSKMDQSKQLYPNQAIPLPVYTNLQELTNAAQRKFSMALPSVDKESVMISSINYSPFYQQGPHVINHHTSPSGSKTPGIRRMTLPEVVLLDKRNPNEVIHAEKIIESSSSSEDDDLTPPGSPFAKAMQMSRSKTKNKYIYPKFNFDDRRRDSKSHSFNGLFSNIPIVKSFEVYQTSLSDQSKDVQQQSSTLTRTSEHHYNCPQVSGAHVRSSSVSDNARIALSNDTGSSTKQNVAEKTRETHYATVVTQELLISELNQQLKRHKSVPSYQPITEQFNTWTDIDPDLPMPPPPSTAEEEIRLASIPIPPHSEVVLRHNSSPKRK